MHTVGTRPAEIGGFAARPEQRRQLVEGGGHLGVAVLLGLRDLPVDAERHVVDEHAAIDLSQVDAPLDRRTEGVERAHDVIAVEAQIEREVVARASGHHDVRDARRAATDATKACDPSPPAIPITSAPRAIAASASCTRSSPCLRTTGSMPRARHSSASLNCSAFPPPDFRFMISTG